MSNNSEFLKKYKRCLYEYVNAAGSYDVSEEGEEEMGNDPAMGGGDPSMGGGDPSMGGGDPSMGGGDPSMGGGQSPEGFNPQGETQTLVWKEWAATQE